MRHHLEVAPILTQIVNASLTHGEFTSELKNALVHPLLKKPGIDCIFKNYRPISNLSFLSKLIERTVCNQITQYTGTTGMAEKFQSAYRASHSTETALIKVKDDILRAIDNQRVTYLILLDLSAAFDTVSHLLLLNRLRHHFGIQGTVLRWFENYMTDRSQKIVLDDSNNKAAVSDHAILKQGVPQGSVLGPVLFTLYTILLVISAGNIMCYSRVMCMTSKFILVSLLFNLVGKINVCNPWEHVYPTYIYG